MSFKNLFFNIIIICVCCLSLSQLAFCQIESDSILCWNKDLQLKWSDFQGKAKQFGKAGCAAELTVESFWDEGINFNVNNCFDKTTSWTVDTVSEHLLEHEKLHFDIAEIHARKIRKAVDSLRRKGINQISPYSEVIKYYLNRRREIDSLYDSETKHSIDSLSQLNWKEKVLKELELLSKYEKDSSS